MLRKLCEEHLCQEISKTNVARLLQIAWDYSCMGLFDKCIYFVERENVTCSDLNDSDDLSQDTLMFIEQRRKFEREFQMRQSGLVGSSKGRGRSASKGGGVIKGQGKRYSKAREVYDLAPKWREQSTSVHTYSKGKGIGKYDYR